MKKMIVLLLALTLLTSFVAPAMARPPHSTEDGEICGCPDPNCVDNPHARGHPLCTMPKDTMGPPGPPYGDLGANAGAQCLRMCIKGTH